MNFKCAKCGKVYEYGELVWRCVCGGYLRLEYKPAITRAGIKLGRLNMWRYDAAYPLKYEDVKATYNEGLTPLLPIKRNGESGLRVKLEAQMPSGSFKDRGMVMAVNYMLSFGAADITEDSSGNAAASAAAYCALSGLCKCRVFVPAGNSSAKIAQARAYGADVTEIPGAREQVAEAAQQCGGSYLGHNWHPMFPVGMRSIAYEIWEQNGFKAPENVIVPCGGGSLYIGITDGFRDLLANGEITAMPRMFAAQPAACDPVARYLAGFSKTVSPSTTLAEGASIAAPAKLEDIAAAATLTNGGAQSISEDEIKLALVKSCKTGIYIEPTSALAFAAYDKYLADGTIDRHSDTVVVATGSGLKTGDTISRLISELYN